MREETVTLDDVYEELIPIFANEGALPDETDFLIQIIEGFTGTKEELLAYVRKNVKQWFKSIGETPLWIQNPKWQFSGGKPMVFVGQIDVPQSEGWFHDDASFFLFWDPETGATETVIYSSSR